MNKLTAEEKKRLWTHVYRTLELPAPLEPNTATLEETLQLHHIIRIDYPALEILQDPSERGVLHKPTDTEQRYQPFPLVYDEDVYANTGRDKVPACLFFSVYKSSSDRPHRRVVRGFLPPDVREAIKYHGKTTLMGVIYQAPQHLGSQIRIRRRTTYFLKDGYEFHDEHDYDAKLDYFFRNQDPAQWYQDISTLIAMRDDRSARCIQHKLFQQQGYDIPGAADLFDRFCSSWKPRRLPDYQVYLNNILTEVKRPSSLLRAKTCKICQKSFKGSHSPAALPCCDKLVSRSCLLEHCQSWLARSLVPGRWKMPACPECKATIFVVHRTRQHLKYGVLADQYMIDKRYTLWENFEWSCADMDKLHASKSNARITINAALFETIWKKMAKYGNNPDDPPHLQPRRFPEYEYLLDEVMFHIRCIDGTTTVLPHLHSFLNNKIDLEFRDRAQKASLHLYLPSGARSWIGNEQTRDLVWRTGFKEYAATVLNRTLQFHVLRKCRCRKGVDFHWDGGREFWNPDVCDGKVMADRDAVVKWQRTEQGMRYLEEFKTWDWRK